MPLTPELQARIPASVLGVHVEGETLADVLPRLREVYCGTIAYEIEHISDHAERAWLRRAIESGRFRQPLARRSGARCSSGSRRSRRSRPTCAARSSARSSSRSRAWTRSCRCSTRRSSSRRSGAHEVVIGIAHRGRLNVLAHTVGRSYASLLREFEGERTIDALVTDPEGGTGDVKYHLAASESRVTRAGRSRSRSRRTRATSRRSTRSSRASRAPSRPIARAAPGSTTRRSRSRSSSTATPRSPGQGVVAETFNLHSLDGYSTGRHAARHRQQPGRLHDRPRGGPLDALLERPRQGVRRPDRPRERRRPGGRARGDPARARVPRGVRPRPRRRPRRLPPLRPQRAGRGGVHAAAAWRSGSSSSRRSARRTPRASSPTACSPRTRPSALLDRRSRPSARARRAADDVRRAGAAARAEDADRHRRGGRHRRARGPPAGARTSSSSASRRGSR